MIDQHFKSTSQAALTEFITKYINVIGPKQGSAAVEAYTDENLVQHEAVPAKGDPDYWYVSIRHSGDEITAEGGVEVSDEETNVSVLGVWA